MYEYNCRVFLMELCWLHGFGGVMVNGKAAWPARVCGADDEIPEAVQRARIAGRQLVQSFGDHAFVWAQPGALSPFEGAEEALQRASARVAPAIREALETKCKCEERDSARAPTPNPNLLKMAPPRARPVSRPAKTDGRGDAALIGRPAGVPVSFFGVRRPGARYLALVASLHPSGVWLRYPGWPGYRNWVTSEQVRGWLVSEDQAADPSLWYVDPEEEEEEGEEEREQREDDEDAEMERRIEQRHGRNQILR